MDRVEVRAVIKYFCKKGNCPPKEIHDNFIKTLGDESPFYSTVRKWAAEFRRGRMSLEDYERPGRPKVVATDENVEHVHSLIMCDRRRSQRDIAGQIGISFGAVQSLLTDILGRSKVSARWIPRMLIKDQKKSRLDISKYLLSLYEADPEQFMRRVVTQDETCVHRFDPEAKKQRMQWKHPGSSLLRNFREFLQKGR